MGQRGGILVVPLINSEKAFCYLFIALWIKPWALGLVGNALSLNYDPCAPRKDNWCYKG